MIKPYVINSNLEEIKESYNEVYEMFEYLDKSRDEYIEENINLKNRNKLLKRLCIIFYCVLLIEFALFLIATI